MTEIAIYLKPAQPYDVTPAKISAYSRIGEAISIYSDENHFPPLEGIDIAIIGVDDDRNAVNNEGCGLAPQAIRAYLYNLIVGRNTRRFADLKRDVFVYKKILASRLSHF